MVEFSASSKYDAIWPVLKTFVETQQNSTQKFISNISQCPEMTLNEIEKTFNKTYTGKKSFLQRFQICFSQNPGCKGVESTS